MTIFEGYKKSTCLSRKKMEKNKISIEIVVHCFTDLKYKIHII
jgi:hypothetical protein